MQMVGANDTDLKLNEDGQPIVAKTTILVSDEECWLQDLKNEAITEEGELFYEDEVGNESYGWSLLDFIQTEYDEFTIIEIQQRIRAKMSKRKYIDAGSIQINIKVKDHICYINVSFKRMDTEKIYSMDIINNGVEVIIR